MINLAIENENYLADIELSLRMKPYQLTMRNYFMVNLPLPYSTTLGLQKASEINHSCVMTFDIYLE